MGDLTKCNYCSYNSLLEKYGKDGVTLVPQSNGWIDVFRVIDGKAVGKSTASYLKLTDHCVC